MTWLQRLRRRAALLAKIAPPSPELIAEHLGLSDDRARAAGYWLEAGERALSNAAHLEAVRHLRRGLEELEALPGQAELLRQELSLQLGLGAALINAKG